MMNIQALDEIQGPMILKIVRKRKGPITPEMYRSAHEAYVRASATITRTHVSKEKILMHVNNNRWSGICPECRSGVTSGRRWPEARCFGCGAIFIHVVWPGPLQMEDIEQALLVRPPVNRNWQHGETVPALVAENIARGLQKVGG